MNTKIRAAVCDDKEEDLKQIEKAVCSSVKRINVSWEVSCDLFQDAQEMLEKGQNEWFDLFLLDIEMPKINGFELAEKLSLNRTMPCIVFVSMYENFIFDSQQFLPLWFVRKSMLEKDIYKAFLKYFELTVLKDANCQLKAGSVLVRDIVYIECNGHSLTIQKSDGSIVKQYGSLKEMEDMLGAYHFLRIHKSYLVNQKYIKDIGKQELYLVNGTKLEIGRDRRKTLKEAISKYKSQNWFYFF